MPALRQLQKLDSVDGNKSEKNVRLQDVEAPRKERDVVNKKYMDDNAGTSNTFNTDDFSVVADDVSLKNKTSYWSCAGYDFHANFPDTNDVHYARASSTIFIDADGIGIGTGVNLPNGAVVTGFIVYGAAGAEIESFRLLRAPHATGVGEIMADTPANSEDTSIADATIDNSAYNYYIASSTLDTDDDVYGARITYTTDYI